MRLSGLGPSPSLFNQRRGQTNGQVNETDYNNNRDEANVNGLNETPNEEVNPATGKTEDPLEDPKVRAEIAELQLIEDKVIAHEQAHMAAGGEFTGGASYGYTVGPNGKRYITSGEVSISIPGGDDPESTLHALERVKAAALAPANPSGQDQRVAASASAKMMSLRTEIAKQKASEAYGSKDEPGIQMQNGNRQREEADNDHKHMDMVI